MAKQQGDKLIVCRNRRARFDYAIEETFEAGLMLMGSEVKSLRTGQASIQESYAGEKEGELFLMNAHIPEYSHGGYQNHAPKRLRKILLHKRQLNRLLGSIRQKGITIIPLAIYFNARGIAKLEIGIARGKKKVEKREAQKERDWKRDKERLMKSKL